MKILKIAAGILLILILAFLAVGLFSPEFAYENSVTIDRPPEQVWKVFTDQDRMGDWLEGLERVENLGGQPLQVGSRWKLVFLQDGEQVEVIEQVTAVKPDEFYAFDIETDPFAGNVEIRFEPLPPGQTLLTATTTVNGRTLLWRSVLRLSKGMLADQSQKSYEKLKQLAESGS